MTKTMHHYCVVARRSGISMYIAILIHLHHVSVVTRVPPVLDTLLLLSHALCIGLLVGGMLCKAHRAE